MVDSVTTTTTANPNSLETSTITLPPPPPPPPPSENPTPPPPAFFSFQRPAIRVTSEFDSDSSAFFNKISCKLFDNLAKFKLSFQNNKNGQISDPQIGFVSKYLSLHYDVEEQNAYLRRYATTLVPHEEELSKLSESSTSMHEREMEAIEHGRGEYKAQKLDRWRSFFLPSPYHLIMVPTRNSFEDHTDRSILKLKVKPPKVPFKQPDKAQQGEVAMVASLADPSYKIELSSAVPSIGLPKATFRFPIGEVSLEEREEEEVKKVLAISGIVKGQLLNGICTAEYKDEDLNLRYSYKDEEVSFIPRISLPSNALSFAFKRRFGPSDKLSYLYNFDSSYWNAVYKHTVGKDLKLKAGYDSEVRLGWASLWVGDEEGKAKTAPMKMKMQFMLQVPQDDLKSPVFIFRVKKRWDI
ncbi:hypothetical protein BVC80_717g10 [Macleaya cordata]|uniref:Outer envelope pore protein 37 n=1 Tax=Macleaya cordata TaxID=56857 RepID=A0A200PM62_MACCD|nr:hypothetical protein BVC80_717g10 [Macleaya cordata]